VDNKGTALIVTMVYLIVVALICAVALGFSSGHYRLINQRVDKFQNFYYAEGGLYMGLSGLTSTNFIVDTDNAANSTVNISTAGGNLQSKRTYQGM